MRGAGSFRTPGAPKSRKRGCRAIRSSPTLRFDVGEDLLHYYCNVDRVMVYATAPVNVAVGARILRQIGAGARDGGQEPRAGSIELAEAGYRAAIGETVAVPCTRHAVDTGYSGVLTNP